MNNKKRLFAIQNFELLYDDIRQYFVNTTNYIGCSALWVVLGQRECVFKCFNG